MGSPISPNYANPFLCHHEVNWLQPCSPEFKPISYMLFKHKSHVEKILNYLYKQHPSIRATCEMEHNNQLPFIDTIITENDGSLPSTKLLQV